MTVPRPIKVLALAALLHRCDAVMMKFDPRAQSICLLPLDFGQHLQNQGDAEGASAMTAKTKEDAAIFVPKERTLPVLRKAVQEGRGCDLYRHATQAVFGELEAGPDTEKPKVSIMMIGEQPGDSEDKEGHPFVGPAGKLLNQCLEEAEIDRRAVYVTNTVKHFKWEPRGKLRIAVFDCHSVGRRILPIEKARDSTRRSSHATPTSFHTPRRSTSHVLPKSQCLWRHRRSSPQPQRTNQRPS